MCSFVICKNVTFYGSPSAVEDIKHLVLEHKRIKEIQDTNEKWINSMIQSGEYKNSEIFSDVYKDVYGIRPHWLYE